MKDIIVIVGPTGIGKTKLSIELAKRLDAEIINGDSVSIYKDLDIGSAKPTIEEREGIPHHLIDIRKVDEDLLDELEEALVMSDIGLSISIIYLEK